MHSILVWALGILDLFLNRETKLNYCLLVAKTWYRTAEGNVTI